MSYSEMNHSLFSNCNKTEAVITGHHLSFSPNPVVLHPDPHNVTVGPTLSVNGGFTITRNVAEFQKRVEGKYQMPLIKKNFKPQPFRLQGDFKVDINIKENALNIGCFSFEFSFK
ncbi:hypothetical protein MAR_009457 [Mya arenaria]|uniref:Uncharacterized protein n=1 Tax=Mya arenaria TaxID=6604 RepID=A0ABY7E3A1_MYAAR|nr:hypothetical protein MAR_009457 [Mya arenaria]